MIHISNLLVSPQIKFWQSMRVKPEFISIQWFFLFTLLIISLSAFAQKTNPPNISDIDEELFQDANAVIIDQLTEVNLIDQSKMIINSSESILVLNENGNSAARAYLLYDKSIKVNKLTVAYYDMLGNVLKRIKKNKFTDGSAISNHSLYEDNRIYFYDKTPLTYPYIMVLEYEYETSNTLFMPSWRPVMHYGTSVARSIYTVINPDHIELKRMAKNFDAYGVDLQEEKGRLTFSVKSIKAIEREDYSLSLNEFVPSLKISPSKFLFEGISGEFDNWESVGQWIYSELLSTQGELPEEVLSEMNDLVAGLNNDKDKVRLIYEYMQNRCRYISVQIGVGGWKPMSAANVHATAYGDCKALTNYTMSLLKAVGIQSFYTIVYGGNKTRDIDKDFISLQGNHAILYVPLESDTLWLECTSEDNPCGYIADFTDDRDVFVVYPDGGQIMHTKKYEDSTHLEKTIGVCQIREDKSIHVDVSVINRGSYYGGAKFLLDLKEDEVEKYYKDQWGLVAGLRLDAYSFADNKDTEILEERLIVTAPDYIKSLGNSVVLRPYILLDNINYRINASLVKKREFYLSSSKTFVSEFTILLPDDLSVETLPEPIEVCYTFGKYMVKMDKVDAHTIKYYREISQIKGVYPKEEYVNYVKMLQLAKKKDALNILLNHM